MSEEFSISSFVFQTISSGALALLGTFLFEPKRHRITQLLSNFDKLEQTLNEVHDIATQYWSKSGNNKGLAHQIIRLKTDCLNLYKNMPEFCASASAKLLIRQFFKEITSSGFQTANQLEDQGIIDRSQDSLILLKGELNKLKPRFSVWLLFRPF